MIRPEGDPVEILAPHELDEEFEKGAHVQEAIHTIMEKIKAEHAAGNNRTYFDTSNHRLAHVLAEKFSLFYEVEKNPYPDSYQGPGGVQLIFRWPEVSSCW